MAERGRVNNFSPRMKSYVGQQILDVPRRHMNKFHVASLVYRAEYAPEVRGSCAGCQLS